MNETAWRQLRGQDENFCWPLNNQSHSHRLPVKMSSHIYKLAIPKAKDVETMANYFENTPKYNIWTPKMAFKTFIWAVAVPYAMYKIAQPFYVRTTQ
jgi:hypothetical protein